MGPDVETVGWALDGIWMAVPPVKPADVLAICPHRDERLRLLNGRIPVPTRPLHLQMRRRHTNLGWTALDECTIAALVTRFLHGTRVVNHFEMLPRSTSTVDC
jgi:hypothetical protein